MWGSERENEYLNRAQQNSKLRWMKRVCEREKEREREERESERERERERERDRER